MSLLRDRYDMFCLPNPPASTSRVIQSSTPTSVLPSSSSTSALGTPQADMFARSHGGASSSSHSGLSPMDRALAAVASRSQSSMSPSSGAASFAAPPTPSNWMVRDQASFERTPVLAHLPDIVPSVASGTSLYSPSAAPVGTPVVSPLLKPRHLGLTAFSDAALQDAVELERAEFHTAAERSGTSRRWTPRSGSSSSLQTPAATVVTPHSLHADGDSPSASATVQRLSRRASATRSVDETRAEEDTAGSASSMAVSGAATMLGSGGNVVVLSISVRRGRSCASTAAEEDPVSAGTPLLAGQELETPAGLAVCSLGQVTLHVSRSSSCRTSAARASSTATTAPCQGGASATAVGAAGSLPIIALLPDASLSAACSTNGTAEAAPLYPNRSPTVSGAQSQQDAPTIPIRTSAAAAAAAAAVAPPPPPQPSPSQHPPTNPTDEGRVGGGGARHTSFAHGQQQQQHSPLRPSSGATLTQQQLAAHLRGAPPGTDSSAFVTMNHFVSGAELHSRPRYSKASSCASLGLYGPADDAADDSGVAGSRRAACTTPTASAAAAAAAARSNATSISSSASAPRPSWGASKSNFANSTSSPSNLLASVSYGSVPSTPGTTAAAAAAARQDPTTDTWMTETPELRFGAAGSPLPPPPAPHLSDAAHSTATVNALAGGVAGVGPLPHPLVSGAYAVPDVMSVGGTARPFRSRVRGVTQPVGATKLLFACSHVPSFSTPLAVVPRSRSTEDVCAGAADGDGDTVNPSTAVQDGSRGLRAAALPPFPPPPPPPPPPSRIPSPMLRSLGHMSGGFAAFSHDQQLHSQTPMSNTSGQHGSVQATRCTVYDVTGRLVMSRPTSGNVSPLLESVPQQRQPPPLPPPSSLPPSRLMSESNVGDEDRGVSCGRSTAFSSKPGSFSSATTTVANTPRHSADDGASRLTSPLLMASTCRSTPVELSQAPSAAHLHLLQQQQQQHESAARRRNAGAVPLPSSPRWACKSCGAISEIGGGGGLGEAALVTAIATPRQLGGGGSSRGSGAGGCRRCSSTSRCDSCCDCPLTVPSPNGQTRTLPVMSTPVREPMSTSVASSLLSLAATVTSVLSDPMVLSFSSANLTAPQSASASNLPGPALTATNAGTGTATGGGPSPHRLSDNFVMRSDAETVQGLPRGKVPRMPGCSMRDWAAHLSVKEAEARRREQQQQQQHHHHRRAPATAPAAGGALTGAAHGGCGAGARFASLPRMTPQEVAQHNTSDDLWMVIRNVVYDCTTFQRFHPGGEKLLLACAGRDATAVYDRFHAWVSCESFMAPYAVGVLAPPDSR